MDPRKFGFGRVLGKFKDIADFIAADLRIRMPVRRPKRVARENRQDRLSPNPRALQGEGDDQ